MVITEVIPLLSYGSSLAVVAVMTYQIQVANGRLRLHSIYNSILVLLQVPLLYVATLHFGALGAAGVWCAVRVLTMVFWTPIVHRIHCPGLHLRWLLVCVLTPLFVSAALAGLLSSITAPVYGGSVSGDFGIIVISAGVTLVVTTLTCLQLLHWFGPASKSQLQ